MALSVYLTDMYVSSVSMLCQAVLAFSGCTALTPYLVSVYADVCHLRFITLLTTLTDDTSLPVDVNTSTFHT